MLSPDRSLPDRPSIEQQKKKAKDLLRAVHAGDEAALARIRRQLPDRHNVTLADAQFTLAREYGFNSWSALRAHIEQLAETPAEAGGLPGPVMDAFQRAFAARDVAAIRDLLQRHPAARAAINEPLFPFDSPALVAFADDLAVVDVLLEFGADPNRRTDWWAGGFHPLHSATGAAADRLIAAGAIPDACAAANLDRLDLLRAILDADPERVNERGGDGKTPLHFARSLAVVDLLLDRGADIDARDIDHRSTPAEWMLDRARGAGRYDLAQYLASRGASTDIFLAAALGLTDALRTMLEADPSLLEQRTAQGEYDQRPPSSYHIYFWTIGPNLSPLQVAAQFQQPQAHALLRTFAAPKQLFLAACADVRAADAKRILREHPQTINQLTPADKRVLPDAAWAPNPAAVKLMMELGFDPATPGHDGGTALHCAAWTGSVAGVAAVLAHSRGRALVDARDATYNSTPLGWCCHGAEQCGNVRGDYGGVARLLLEAGATLTPDYDQAPEPVRSVILAYRKQARERHT